MDHIFNCLPDNLWYQNIIVFYLVEWFLFHISFASSLVIHLWLYTRFLYFLYRLFYKIRFKDVQIKGQKYYRYNDEPYSYNNSNKCWVSHSILSLYQLECVALLSLICSLDYLSILWGALISASHRHLDQRVGILM